MFQDGAHVRQPICSKIAESLSCEAHLHFVIIEVNVRIGKLIGDFNAYFFLERTHVSYIVPCCGNGIIIQVNVDVT